MLHNIGRFEVSIAKPHRIQSHLGRVANRESPLCEINREDVTSSTPFSARRDASQEAKETYSAGRTRARAVDIRAQRRSSIVMTGL